MVPDVDDFFNIDGSEWALACRFFEGMSREANNAREAQRENAPGNVCSHRADIVLNPPCVWGYFSPKSSSPISPLNVKPLAPRGTISRFPSFAACIYGW